jgi:hypothetical protein
LQKTGIGIGLLASKKLLKLLFINTLQGYMPHFYGKTTGDKSVKVSFQRQQFVLIFVQTKT